MRRFLMVLCGATFLAAGGEVAVTGSAGRVDVNVVRRVDLGYHLVTGRVPLEFEVEGPAWVRVYTRAWWPKGAEGTKSYGLSLWQDEVERPLEFETARSTSSWSRGRHAVGRWRSFYIQVPAGSNAYRLVVNDAPLDTVAVRFSLEAPRPWGSVALGGFDRMELVEGEARETLYRLDAGQDREVEVSGPCRVRVRLRLNFEQAMVGAQNFVLTVAEGGRKLVEENFRVTRTGSAEYANAPNVVPSSEKSVRFRLGDGNHRLRIRLSGTLATSAGFKVERIASEKYE